MLFHDLLAFDALLKSRNRLGVAGGGGFELGRATCGGCQEELHLRGAVSCLADRLLRRR